MTDDLIDRIRAAKGPDTWLDFEIQQHIEGWRNLGGGWREWADGTRERYDYIQGAPAYTSSIDTAMSLVPGGWYGRVEPRFYEGEVVRWLAYAIKPDWSKVGTPLERDDFPHTETEAATPALALIIAALEARKG